MMKNLLSLLAFVPIIGYGQFTQNFDAGTTIPTGWTVVNGGDTPGTWQIVNVTGGTISAHSGTNMAAIGYGATAHDDYFITPAITVTAGVSDFFTFWARSRDPLFPEQVSLELSSTGTAPLNFSVVLDPTVAPASGATFYKYQYDLTAYVGQTVYIAFHSTTTDKFFFDLDDVEVSALPSCFAPTAPTFVSATTTSANVSWTPGGTINNFEVNYGAPGFTAGTGTTVTATTASATIPSLTASTTYAFYVRTNCGSGNFSAWTGPVSFTTSCTSVATFPYTEGFEATTIPTCWANQTVTGNFSWTYVTANGNNTITPRTGTRMAEFRNTTADSKTKLVTAPLDLTTVTNPQLTFYYANTNWVGDIDELRVFYKTTSGGAWVQIGSDYTTEHTTWTAVTLPLPNPSATYYIAFEGTSNWARGINLDDITVDAALATPTFDSASFKAYPNPVKNFLNLSYKQNIDTVEVYNLLGQQVISKAINQNETQIDMSNMASGGYFVKVHTGDSVKTIKVIKE